MTSAMRAGIFASVTLAALLAVAPAQAGSVTQPGETIGLAAGAPLPEGWYALDTTDYGQRTPPSNVYVGATIPVIAWSTPWHLAGAQVQLLAAAPLVEAGTSASHVGGWYNPWFASQFAWDVGNGIGVSYLLGVYPGLQSDVADHNTSLNQRLGLSYTGGTYDLTANIIYGNQLSGKTSPDFLNVDLTAVESFGKWTVGPVGYISTDTSKPYSGYKTQSQIDLGLMGGYNLGTSILQAYITRGVAQQNYGGDDTRVFFRIIVPIA